jgi:vacuolar-type H+-ATPase subunit E/Vma4
MCKRVSWIKTNDNHLLYLTTYDLFDTPQGKAVREQLSEDDWIGHTAIKMFYGYKPQDRIGAEQECTDFSSPFNFPDEIAQAIKDGKFMDVIDSDILTVDAFAKYEKIEQSAYDEYKKIEQSACAEYEKIRQPAYDEYKKIEQSAYAEYEKIEQSAYAEYKRIRQPAYAEYKKIRQPAYAEYEKIEQSAYAEYEKIEQPAYAEYKKIRQPAYAEYEKIGQPAYAEYKKIRQSAFWNLFSDTSNRVDAWK